MNPEPTKTEDRSILYGTVFGWTAALLRLRQGRAWNQQKPTVIERPPSTLFGHSRLAYAIETPGCPPFPDRSRCLKLTSCGNGFGPRAQNKTAARCPRPSGWQKRP